MKNLFLLFLLGIIGGFLYFSFGGGERSSQISSSSKKAEFGGKAQEEQYIFIPYWTFSNSISAEDYDSVIYFGITIDKNGVDLDEEGYKKIPSFIEAMAKEKKKYLALRLIKNDLLQKLSSDSKFQKMIADETVRIAKDNEFEGVVIDFETSAFGFESTEKMITSLYKTLSEQIRHSGLEVISVMFGDSYYRARPYNIREIASFSDKIIIMAYDFHKARLNPGPNFPFSDSKRYGYDFKTMLRDFEKDIPLNKMIVALGYFGYDWRVDENGDSIEMARPLSTNQGVSRFLNECLFTECEVVRNFDDEPMVHYRDEDGMLHEVWFEDETSIAKKKDFLETKGILQTAIWAYSFN